MDKASTKSRGSRQNPAPTLRIVPSTHVCHGVAFEFAEEAREAVLSELLEREGKTFPLREKQIRLEDGRQVEAFVPIYEGKHLLGGCSLRELAQMAISAKGDRGTGVDYVRDIARYLETCGIQDKAVSELLSEIESLQGGNTRAQKA